MKRYSLYTSPPINAIFLMWFSGTHKARRYARDVYTSIIGSSSAQGNGSTPVCRAQAAVDDDRPLPLCATIYDRIHLPVVSAARSPWVRRPMQGWSDTVEGAGCGAACSPDGHDDRPQCRLAGQCRRSDGFIVMVLVLSVFVDSWICPPEFQKVHHETVWE